MKPHRSKFRHRLLTALACSALLLAGTGCQSTGSSSSRTEREPAPNTDATLAALGWFLYLFPTY